MIAEHDTVTEIVRNPNPSPRDPNAARKSKPGIKAFFGDDEKMFRLTPELIVELERKTGAGIGGLCRRLFAGDFRHADVIETIRLSLIGGGTTPKEAAALVAAYASKPLTETYALAVAILDALWNGTDG